MKLYVLAGEPSGDAHAANVVQALRTRVPGLHVRGLGGDKLAAAGQTLVEHVRNTSFMGFVEVIQHLKTIQGLFKAIKADMRAWQPDVLLCVDYPGFNLRMAKWAKETLGCRVVYYIAPQLWAWKSGRVETIRKYVDQLLVILPFEPAWYAPHGVVATFVGHPLLETLPTPVAPHKRPALRPALGLPPEKPLVALLPGSRPGEIATMLPRFAAAAQQFPETQFAVAAAANRSDDFYQKLLRNWQVPILHGQTPALLQAADHAWVTSGTATLETGLLGTPLLVAYRGDWPSYYFAKYVLRIGRRIRYIALVNLILDRPAVPELIQGALTPSRLAELHRRYAEDPALCAATRVLLDELRAKLGGPGASARAAEAILAGLH